MPDQKKTDAPDQKSERDAAPTPAYAVLTDTWGYLPQFVKGDLVSPADAPEYDFGWAERLGVIQRVEGGRPARASAAATPSPDPADDPPPPAPGEPPKQPQA